jgi:hypothetical protein
VYFGLGSGLVVFRHSISNSGSAVFRLRTLAANKMVDSQRLHYLPSGMVRAEGARSLNIINSEKEQFLTVDHARQTAVIKPIYDLEATQRIFTSTFGALLQMEGIQEVKERSYVLDNRPVREFTAIWDGAVTTVIVDKESALPVKLELDRGKDNDGHAVIEVADQFEFGRKLSPELFSMVVPDGYEVQRVERRLPDQESASYVLSETGLGPVRFGMSVDEVRSLLGAPDSVDSRPAEEPEMKDGSPVIVPGKGFRMVPADPPYNLIDLRYDSRGFRVGLSSIKGVINIRCFDELTYGASTRKFLGQSSEGVKIGMSRAEVKELLGLDGLPIVAPFQFDDSGRLKEINKTMEP